MQRIFVSPLFWLDLEFAAVFAGCFLLSTCTSNLGRRDRHGVDFFFAVSIFAYMENELAWIFGLEEGGRAYLRGERTVDSMHRRECWRVAGNFVWME
jgi:hypothetical protein